MEFIPAYPYMFVLRRINKAWKHELDNRVFDRVHVLDLFNWQEETALFNTWSDVIFAQTPTVAAAEEENSTTKRPRFKSFSSSSFNDNTHCVTLKSVCKFLPQCFPNVKRLRLPLDDRFYGCSFDLFHTLVHEMIKLETLELLVNCDGKDTGVINLIDQLSIICTQNDIRIKKLVSYQAALNSDTISKIVIPLALLVRHGLMHVEFLLSIYLLDSQPGDDSQDDSQGWTQFLESKIQTILDTDMVDSSNVMM